MSIISKTLTAALFFALTANVAIYAQDMGSSMGSDATTTIELAKKGSSTMPDPGPTPPDPAPAPTPGPDDTDDGSGGGGNNDGPDSTGGGDF